MNIFDEVQKNSKDKCHNGPTPSLDPVLASEVASEARDQEARAHAVPQEHVAVLDGHELLSIVAAAAVGGGGAGVAEARDGLQHARVVHGTGGDVEISRG